MSTTGVDEPAGASVAARMVAQLTSQLFGRFALVSLASLVTGHILLYGIHVWMGVDPVPSNLLSTTGNTALVFVANRRWVWRYDGEVSVRREVVPFALLALAGLGLSTLFVWITAAFIGEGLWVNAANLTAFGIVWLARFFILDAWIYGQR